MKTIVNSLVLRSILAALTLSAWTGCELTEQEQWYEDETELVERKAAQGDANEEAQEKPPGAKAPDEQECLGEDCWWPWPWPDVPVFSASAEVECDPVPAAGSTCPSDAVPCFVKDEDFDTTKLCEVYTCDFSDDDEPMKRCHGQESNIGCSGSNKHCTPI